MSRDLRKYSSQTMPRLIVGAIILLFLVGTGLIAWLCGSQTALTGLLCMLIALVPIGLSTYRAPTRGYYAAPGG